MSLVATIKYDSFYDLYHALLPGGREQAQEKDIFRGVSCASYDLLSSALRELRGKTYSEFACYQKEHSQLVKFYNEANRRGLKLPYSNLMHDILLSEPIYKRIPFKSWYPDRASEELAALAQHYGIKTRMLDWTYNFHVALYFASVNVCKRIVEKQSPLDTHAALWRLRLPLYSEELESTGFRTVVPPYAGNPNLQAQQGVLTYIQVHDFEAPVNTTPLEEFFNGLPIKRKTLNALATKYVFPVEECFSCLKALR